MNFSNRNLENGLDIFLFFFQFPGIRNNDINNPPIFKALSEDNPL